MEKYMAKWTKLRTAESEDLVWIDTDKVLMMRRIKGEPSHTHLIFSKDFSWNVLEAPETIAPEAR
jgi:hypothetical protein